MNREQYNGPKGHVVSPMVVGGSVIALKCKEGVIMGSDTLLSYGGLLKYPDICRFATISEGVVVTATGEYSDFQEAVRKLQEMTRQTEIYDDGVSFEVKDYASYLASICYDKRNNQNPYYNNFVIAGFQNGQPHLASVDLYGSHIAKDYVTAGFSKHFGTALVAREWNKDKSYEQCKKIIEKCFSVLYMRDCHAIDSIQFTKITRQGIKINQFEKVPSTWEFRQFRERDNAKLWR